jgi:hypothetical protein
MENTAKEASQFVVTAHSNDKTFKITFNNKKYGLQTL